MLELNVTFGAVVDDVAGCRFSVGEMGSHEANGNCSLAISYLFPGLIFEKMS